MVVIILTNIFSHLLSLFSPHNLFHSAGNEVTLVPSINLVCPNGRAVFTCTTTSGKLRWTISSVKVYYNSPEDINRAPVVIRNAGFSVKLDKAEGNVFVSTATADNIPFDFEGETVACADTPSHSASERTAVIKLSG